MLKTAEPGEPLARPITLLKSDLEHLETVARRAPPSAEQHRQELMHAVEALHTRWRITRQLQQNLRTEATQIDPALHARARALAAADRRLVAILIRLHRVVFDAVGSPDDPSGQAVIDDLLAWCADCRVQLAEHSHLLQDAHYRDRGVAD